MMESLMTQMKRMRKDFFRVLCVTCKHGELNKEASVIKQIQHDQL